MMVGGQAGKQAGVDNNDDDNNGGTRGSGTNGGDGGRGWVGEVEGYVRMQRWRLGAAGEGRGGRQRQQRGEGWCDDNVIMDQSKVLVPP
jgi:hypothetical protein